MQVWQTQAGDRSRDYSWVFREFGVMLVGPGSPGDYQSHRAQYDDPDDSAYRAFLSPFAETMAVDDLVVLKRPSGRMWEVMATGVVRSGYRWIEAFADVDGWDLQHARLVQWRAPAKKTVIHGLTRGTLKRVRKPEVIRRIQRLWDQGVPIPSQSPPAPPIRMTTDELIRSLIETGLPVSRAEDIAQALTRIQRLAGWYGTNGQAVGEHEIRTFMIAPLVTALGWSEQQIKIEWYGIDMALFRRPYVEEAEPLLILESKRLGHGLEFVDKQAEAYANDYPNCRALIVSDGLRYKLFNRSGATWKPSAYANLVTPTQMHPYQPGVGGAAAFFMEVLPEAVSGRR